MSRSTALGCGLLAEPPISLEVIWARYVDASTWHLVARDPAMWRYLHSEVVA